MIKFITGILLILFNASIIMAQDYTIANDTPAFRKIPEYPENYTATTVMARMIDGLGFRYYWATEGLSKSDLNYLPSENARTCGETLDHIYDLSALIWEVAQQKTIDRDRPKSTGLTFEQKRNKTLYFLKEARNLIIKMEPEALEKIELTFQSGDATSSFPLWHLINGPITDAIWHVGQVVTFRRTTDNPFNSKVSVFHGKLFE